MAVGLSDYLGFTALTVLLVGAINWGTVAIRYAAGDLPEMVTLAENATKFDVYRHYPTPDLLDVLGGSVMLQMVVYWIVFAAGLFYMGLFIWNSIEMRTVPS